MTEERLDFREVIGLVLRYGVFASFAAVALGSALLFLEGGTGYYSLGTAQQLVGAQNKFLLGFGPVLQGAAAAKPYAIIELGLILLLATPVARVTISIFLFAAEKRWIFVAITATVLAILAFSMFVVAPLVSP
jgi:uncharacterized membrane protein